MKLPTGWQEGEVVELQAARRAYEDFLHRRQDPALLEKQGGNQFRARVFPIEASADKELILSFSQELRAEGEPYRIHLRGLPEVEALDHPRAGGAHAAGGAVAAYVAGRHRQPARGGGGAPPPLEARPRLRGPAGARRRGASPRPAP